MQDNTREHIKLFISALRSGKYKKTKWRLRKGDCYCTKGVACEVFRLNTGLGEWRGQLDSESEQDFSLHEEEEFQQDSDIDWPRQVAEWYGIKKTYCETEVKFNDIEKVTIEQLNDEYDLTFHEMADVIQDNFL